LAPLGENPRDRLSEGEHPEPGDLPQVFLPRANLFFRAFLIGLPVLLLAGTYAWYRIYRSPVWTQVTVPVGQPVLFSHRHHAGELKIDCRYCHTSVEKSSFAGVPPTETCMTCHSQLFVDSPLLAPVQRSFATAQPIRWNRVHNLPDYVYFDHAVHVEKGVGCSTCHGQVNEMPLVWKDQTLFMEWCLDCHRKPEANLRPVAKVYDFDWKPGPGQAQAGASLAKDVHLDPAHLTNCSVCHE
jgi:hypothetical protein